MDPLTLFISLAMVFSFDLVQLRFGANLQSPRKLQTKFLTVTFLL